MNDKQIPFRYPESLEKDIEELRRKGLYGYNLTKNKVLIKAVEDSAKIKRALKSFKDPTHYYADSGADIDSLIKALGRIASTRRKSKGDLLNINDLDIQTDIKKHGHKK